MDLVNNLRAALAGPGQGQRFLRLHTSLGGDVLVAETLDGVEQIDGIGFQWTITALSVDAGLALAGLVGQGALLELQQADGSLRPLHGRITAAERLGSNGGLARYRLRLQPWLAFLSQRVDSYVFHDKTVVEIVEDIFADYQGLAPAWRWSLGDASQYARRSLTTQYHESDLAFIQRLLAEEGIYYWFEHAGDSGGSDFGSHTLVLADHSHDTRELGGVRFHRRDASERSDTVQQWSDAYRWRPSKVERATWDYRTLERRQASAQAEQDNDLGIVDSDTCGPYGWQDNARGQRRAQQHLDALRVQAHTIEGAGQWRQLAPGSRFTLQQHPQVGEDAAFLCLSVHHQARNNLDADVFDALEQQLGSASVATPVLPGALAGLAYGDDPAAITTAFYDNRFVAIPAEVSYRPQTVDGHGAHLHPRPTITGTLSAIVVSDGDPLLSDRDHRIKVQFPWQRGGNASHGLAHPGGDDNAPATGGAWTWVRVMTPWAGDNWGGVVLPRRGQEVLVAFLEGDIDRPVVVGAVYNGRGQQDAQHNQVQGGGGNATGNAAAWFEGNDHAAVYTGFKSQALADSQGGTGGYQQLRFDDTPGQGRAQLSTTQHQSTLTLGHLKGGDDNVREAERGFGVELSTQAQGALRAGRGLLLTTEQGTPQLAAPQALTQLQESQQLLQQLAGSAKSQQAQLPSDPDELPVDATLKELQEHLRATQSGSAAGSISGGDGDAPGWSAPILMGSGVAGLLSLTPADQVWVSGTHTTLVSGVALNWMTQGSLTLAVAGGLVLYTAGVEASGESPNQERGIALHAAQGKVSARAHKNQAIVAAKTQVRIVSTEADVQLSAPAKHLLATAAGAYIRIEGDNIELGAPGKVEFKASQREWTGPASVAGEVKVPEGALDKCNEASVDAAKSGAANVTL
ncbi:type VI secretion system Vgr family protein [Stenotrophomonas sp. 24(2023)]|uniref:type VI secretion system Vgr family protein n=1 Tax=Stenotrophomonas sp. 24(2023) TaxID=3068324 RepID=UPI0027DF0E0E|nr:type VI secretion system Vgr family protein [Stenotrophomonas sp. 24(2023)]WMJ69541.1 type VI secretion system tip protein TssI/VgrG [Stenotrophomonas sp. 24(2023)]